MPQKTPYGPDQIRRRQAIILGISAVVMALLALGSFPLARAMSGETRLSGKVLPNFSAQMPEIETITIVWRGVRYDLVKRGSQWVIPQRGNYPVQAETLAHLAKGLSDLSYKTLRTSDPAQFARLGVGPPSVSSPSALISFKNAARATLASLYIGRRGETMLVRKSGSDDVFEVSGNLPELGPPALWLDLQVIDIAPETIASVSGQRQGAASYDIVRRPDGGFAPLGGRPNVTATTAAIALTKWSPLDVAPARTLTVEPVAIHTTRLRTGLGITATAYEAMGRYWVRLSAVSETADQIGTAAELNQRLKNWAFQVSASDFADLTFPLDAIVSGPGAVTP